MFGLDCSKKKKRKKPWKEYEEKIKNEYGNQPYEKGKYKSIVDGEEKEGVADAITTIDGKKTAVDAKYDKDWNSSIRNSNSKIGQKSFSKKEQNNMVIQAKKYTNSFPGGVIYHINSEELRDHYTKIFEEAGITNFQFKITK